VALLASLASRLAQVAVIGPALARLKRRAVRVAIGGALIGLFGVMGFAYLIVALRNGIEPYLGPIWTPVAIGGGLLLLAGIAYLVFIRPRGAEASTAEAQAAAVRDKIVGPARKLEGQVAKSPLQSLAIALAVGFAAASLLRILRGRQQAGAPRPYDGAGLRPPPHPASSERPAWMREVVLRETERRRRNGKSA
jgi:hypothetical protein